MPQVIFYLDQVANLMSVNLEDDRVYRQLEAENRQLITAFNIAAVAHRLPPRANISGESEDPVTAHLISSYSRRLNPEIHEILRDMGYKKEFERACIFPGLKSYNLEDKTVNVHLTDRDFLNNRTHKMRMGKYLKRCGYDDDFVNRTANEFTSLLRMRDEAVLSIAIGADIVRIYEKGPYSCMSGYADQFDGGIHPAEVYDSPDVACGYVTLNDHIVARSMLNEIDETYSKIYGNGALLKPLLEDAGYTSGYLDGCRIRRIESDSTGVYIMPYIDGADKVGEDEDPEYFVVGGGRYDYHRCTGTNGLSAEGSRCPACGDMFDPEYDGVWVEAAEEAFCCTECVESAGYVYADDTCEFHCDDDVVYCETDSYYYYRTDDLVMVDDNWYKYDDDDIVYSEDQDEYIMQCDATYVDSIGSWVDDDRSDEFEEEYEDEVA